MEAFKPSMNQSEKSFPLNSFLSFLHSIENHLISCKKDQLCLETSKYRYNLPSDIRIYDLDQVKTKYIEFFNNNHKFALNSNVKWQIDQTNLFVFIVLYYLEINSKGPDSLDENDWGAIGKLIFRSGKECETKWNSLMKSRSNKKSWSSEEDQLLAKIIKGHLKKSTQISWVNVSQELFEKSERKIIKMARRCRERWINYLNPNLKNLPEYLRGSWSHIEDITLLEKYLKFNKKWSTISESLKGRNLNSVKNRFHSILKKNGITDPENESIQALIEKLKNSEGDEKSQNDEETSSDEEIKQEVNPQKKVKTEENETTKAIVAPSIRENNRSMPELFQFFYPFSPFLNMLANPLSMMPRNEALFPFLNGMGPPPFMMNPTFSVQDQIKSKTTIFPIFYKE